MPFFSFINVNPLDLCSKPIEVDTTVTIYTDLTDVQNEAQSCQGICPRSHPATK